MLLPINWKSILVFAADERLIIVVEAEQPFSYHQEALCQACQAPKVGDLLIGAQCPTDIAFSTDEEVCG